LFYFYFAAFAVVAAVVFWGISQLSIVSDLFLLLWPKETGPEIYALTMPIFIHFLRISIILAGRGGECEFYDKIY